MEITRDTRMQKLNLLSPRVQHLYVSEEAGAKYYEIFDKYNIPEAKYGDYVLAVGDVVLGFYPISQLTDLLINNAGIAEETARRMTAELIEYLSPILEGGQRAANEKAAGEEEQPKFIPTSVTYGPLGEPQQARAGADAGQSEAVEEEAVQPLRTMEEDMDKIHGYGAYRKMFPDAEGQGGASPQQPAEQAKEETVHQATSQDEVLNKRPPLTGTPSYDEPPQQ